MSFCLILSTTEYSISPRTFLVANSLNQQTKAFSLLHYSIIIRYLIKVMLVYVRFFILKRFSTLTHQLKIVKVPEKNARKNRLHFQLLHTQGGSKHLISKYFVFVRRRKIDFCWSIYPFLAIFKSFSIFSGLKIVLE